MEYRNSGVNTHLGGGLVAGVDRNAATEILGSSITAASDSAAAGLTITAKGTGTLTLGDSSNVVSIGGSTTPLKIVTGESSYRPPDLSSFAIAQTTFAMANVSTGDVIMAVDFRQTLSTAYLVGTWTPSSAGECKVQLANPRQSTISGSSGRVRWAYLDRT